MALVFSLLVRAQRCAALALLIGLVAAHAEAKWKYLRNGNPADSAVAPRPGFALMGSSSHEEAAFRYLCELANGGDFLVLSAHDDDAYLKKVNAEIEPICPLNSVATLSFSAREDSSDPKVVEIIDQAESIYLAGGDQSDYVRFWQDTPVEDALNRHIASGKPLGGASAGLAVLGEFSFTSMIDTIHSGEALAHPYGNKVTLSREFLRIPILAGTITDTHFVKRDRMGRLLVFMARILEDGWASRVRAIAVEENAALLVEPDGTARVVGAGPVYFLEAAGRPAVCRSGQPLTFSPVRVARVASGKTFRLKPWTGEATTYTLAVEKGVVRVWEGASDQGIY